jgi:predicted nuclease with TOPRIM domain
MTTTTGMTTTEKEALYLSDVIRETKALISHFDSLPVEGDTAEEQIDQAERRKGVMSDLRTRLKELEEEVEAL